MIAAIAVRAVMVALSLLLAAATHQPARTALPAAPSTAEQPPTAVIHCNDGTVSHAEHRQGACSHHGGIAWTG